MKLLSLIDEVAARLTAADVYFGHGTDNATDEAAYLIAAVIGFDRVYADDVSDISITDGQKVKIEALILQRIQSRKPTAYLVNRAWFCGYEFYVDERVLIPRSPIAELIQDQFQPWVDVDAIKSILDIGTGSGCIAIAAAHCFPSAEVDAIDVDAAALTVTNKNIGMHSLEHRVFAIHSNLFENLGSKQYDLIIANPPYVSDAEMKQLPDEYSHEPAQALRADEEGLAIVNRILINAAHHLNNNGKLILEVGNSMTALVQRYAEVPFFWFEFANGGDGVCMLDKSQLLEFFQFGRNVK